MTMKWSDWEGKKVHIILKNNWEYNCQVISVDDTGVKGLVFFNIIDRYGKPVTFSTDNILFIELQKGEH
jgi:hypothetical protein